MSDIEILCGLAVGVTGLCLVMEAMMLGSPDLGWITRPWYSRGCMIAVGLLFWARSWTIFHGQAVPPVGVVLSAALLLWRVVEVLHVVRTSWANEAVRALRLAADERRKARKVLQAVVELSRLPIWRNGRWRDPRA